MLVVGDHATALDRADPPIRVHAAPHDRLSRPVLHPGEDSADLLSPQASFVNWVTLPVDGGRAALGLDPEAS